MGLLLKICISVKEHFYFFYFFCKDQLLQDEKKMNFHFFD